MDIPRTLQIEAEAARSLIANIRDVIGDDEEAAQDAIEGETNFLEAMSAALSRLSDIETMVEAIGARMGDLIDRKKRLANQGETLRAAMLAALAQAERRKLELPEGTLSIRRTSPKVVVTSEADIPAEYWKRADPKLDLKALLAAVKEGPVPGAELSNGGETLDVRTK